MRLRDRARWSAFVSILRSHESTQMSRMSLRNAVKSQASCAEVLRPSEHDHDRQAE